MGVVGSYLEALLPPWLARPRGKRFWLAFGAVADQLRDDAAFAVAEGMLEECTDDALPAHGRNSNLPRARSETWAHFRAYLRTRWTVWRASGSLDGMEAAIARLGFRGTAISTLDLTLAGEVNPFGNYTGFFYVRIDYPSGFSTFIWDGSTNWADGHLWGVIEPYVGAIDDLRAVIRKFKPAHTSCRYIEIRLGGGMSPPAITIPMWEDWERDPVTGGYPDFYNTHW